jgi:hypothetical protein
MVQGQKEVSYIAEAVHIKSAMRNISLSTYTYYRIKPYKKSV